MRDATPDQAHAGEGERARTSRAAPREEILALLRRSPSLGVEALAEALDLAPATVRRHLDVLQRDDLVRVERVRGQTGRPRHLYVLTEAGAEISSHHYVRMTHRLLGEIVALPEGDTSGRDGSALASVVFDRMAGRLIERYASQVTGTTLRERAGSALALLAEEGLEFELLEPEAPLPDIDAVSVLGRGCLCSRLGRGGSSDAAAPCEHDRRVLATLVGAEVEPLPASAIPHAFQVGYRLTPR